MKIRHNLRKLTMVTVHAFKGGSVNGLILADMSNYQETNIE